MIHHVTIYNPGDNHYGVSYNDKVVLVQLQEDGEQARIPITPEEARYIAQLLIDAANKVEVHV